MKYTTFIFCIFLLSSCASSPHILDPRERIIEVRSAEGYIYGRGVFMDSGTLLTAKHVYDACDRSGECVLFSKDEVLAIHDGSISRVQGDAFWISVRSTYDIKPIQILETPPIGSELIVYQDILSYTGRIIATGVRAVGYDDTILSGSISTGAIETDIVLEVGQSGTPVWTLSGDLIGVMSSVDRERGRSWIVR